MNTTSSTAKEPVAACAPIPGLMLASDHEFQPALMLGLGLPARRNGFDCHYRKKESLRPGRFRDGKGTVWNISAKDIDEAVADINRALACGHEPAIQNDHYKPTKTFGWIKGAQKNSRGGLDLLHQFLGDQALDEALKLKTSIMLLPNFEDERGNKFKWWPEHQAAVPNPQMRDLEDYKPALAASNGQLVEAIQLLSADDEVLPQEKNTVDLSPLRNALGVAADNRTDDQILMLCAREVTEMRGKLKELHDSNASLTQQLSATGTTPHHGLAAGGRSEDEATNPQVLAMSARLAEKDIQLAQLKNRINERQATHLRERIKTSSALMLGADRTSGRTPVEELIAFASLGDSLLPNKPVVRGTPVRALALSADHASVDPELNKTMVAMANGVAAAGSTQMTRPGT